MRKFLGFWGMLFALVLASGLAASSGPTDTSIPVAYGPVTTAMPYNGTPGYAVVGASQVATSTLGNNFNSAFRGDILATSGGLYNSTQQSAYLSVNAQSVLRTQGQGDNYFGFVGGYGKGNALFGNGDISCYGGGEVGLPSSTPECGALGEFEADQGTAVWSATLSNSPGAGGTAFTYSSPVNNAFGGSRAILNPNHTTGGTGTISSYVTCQDGVGGSGCPAHCAGGTGSFCTLINFAGSTINTTSGLNWYFKAGSTTDNYAGSCNGDDVSLPNAAGPGVARCLGHWYKVSAVNSATQIVLFGLYDTFNLGEYLGSANYMMVQGQEAVNFNTSTNSFTLDTNGNTWSSGDPVYAPPSHYMAMVGANLIFTKYYKDGGLTSGTPSDGIRIANFGPALMDNGVLITGGALGAGNGGFLRGIEIEYLNPRTSGNGTLNDTIGIDMTVSDVNYAMGIRGGAQSPPTNIIAWGDNGQDQEYEDRTTHTHTFFGEALRLMTGLFGDGGGAKHIRVSTGTISGSTTTAVTVTWTTAFGNASYTPVCNVLDSTGFLSVAQITNLQASSIAINVKNSDTSAHTGTLLCHAFHD